MFNDEEKIEAPAENLPELTTQQLLDEVSKGHRALKVYEKGVQMLQGLVKLEQNITEKTAVCEKLKATEKDWLAQKQAALNAAEDAGKRAQDMLAAAGVEAKNIAEDARRTGQTLIVEAKKQADSLVSAAKTQAATHLEISEAIKSENAATNAALSAKKKELADVTTALAQHKEAIKKFVG